MEERRQVEQKATTIREVLDFSRFIKKILAQGLELQVKSNKFQSGFLFPMEMYHFLKLQYNLFMKNLI